MVLKYNCLILDHDDTSINSTESIYYPAFYDTMKELGKSKKIINIDEYIDFKNKGNKNRNFVEVFKDKFDVTDEEFKLFAKRWGEYYETHLPEFVEGFYDFFKEYQSQGGKIFVLSDNQGPKIKPHYSKIFNDEILPDMIYGREIGREKRKPSTWTLEEISRKYDIKPQEICVLDDKANGMIMANNYGSHSVGSRWFDKYDPDTIKTADICFENFNDFSDYILNK